MLRAVLDTNIVISALLFSGATHAVASAWQEGKFVWLVSARLLKEYIRALHYPKFHLTSEEVRSLIEEEIAPFLTPVRVRRVPRVIRADPSDDQVLACALAGQADVMVSGDAHVLSLERYHHIPIMTPAQFLSRLGPR